MVPGVLDLLSCCLFDSVGMASERSDCHRHVGSLTNLPQIGRHHEVARPDSGLRGLLKPGAPARSLPLSILVVTLDIGESIGAPFSKGGNFGALPASIQSFFSMSLKKSIVSEGDLAFMHSSSMVAR